MKRHHLALITAALLLGFSSFMGATGIAHATLITVDNASFEDNICSDGQFSGGTCGGVPLGWSGNGASWNPSAAQAYGGIAPDGNNVAFLTSGVLYQDVGEAIMAGYTYTLEVEVGNRADLVDDGFWYLTLQDDTNIVASASGQNTNSGTFETASLTYTALSDGALGNLVIALRYNGGPQVNYDDVRLYKVAAVPEPATLMLFGVGLLALGFLHHRRKLFTV